LYVSAGEDFELAGPQDTILNECEFEPQSGYEPHAGEEGEELIDESDNVPESPTPITSIGQEEPVTNPGMHVYFGESLRSIRALLKRYCFHQGIGHRSQAYQYYWIASDFPCEPGQSRFPQHFTGATATPSFVPYNYTAMTYLNWFTPCYVARRGGLRSKYISNNSAHPGILSVRRIGPAVNQNDCDDYDYNLEGESSSTWNEAILQMYQGTAGTAIAHPNVDGGLEVEFPMYSNKRFIPCRQFLDGSAGNNELNENGVNAGHIGFYDSGKKPGHVLRYVAGADDYSLFMFIGSPPIYRRSRPTSGTSLTIQGGY